MVWNAIVAIIPFLVSIMKFFVDGKDRQNEIEQNMKDWGKKKTSAGEVLAGEQTELEKQKAEELARRETNV